MKNLEQREGFANRHTDGLPDQKCTMNVVVDGNIHLCHWHPFDKRLCAETDMPGDGYVGTAIVAEGRYKGIGFHAWSQNNDEFVWYAVV